MKAFLISCTIAKKGIVQKGFAVILSNKSVPTPEEIRNRFVVNSRKHAKRWCKRHGVELVPATGADR